VSEIPADCLPFDDDLSALIDAELDDGRAAEVRAHVESCPHCTRRLEALSGVDLALGELPIPEVSEDLSRRLEARLAPAAPVVLRPRQSVRRARRGWRVAGALAAAAAVGLVVLLGLPGEPPSPGPQVARAPTDVEPGVQVARAPTDVEPGVQVARAPTDVEPGFEGAPRAPDSFPERMGDGTPGIQLALAEEQLEDVALLLAVDDLAEPDDMGLVANLELVEMLVDLGPPEGV